MNFTGRIITHASFAAIIQLLTIAVMPFILRIYGPQEFGGFAAYEAVVGPLSVFVCGGYTTAIVLANRIRERSALITLCCVLSATTTLVVTVAIFGLVGLQLLPEYLNTLIWLLPLSLLLHGLFLIARYLCLKDGKVGWIGVGGLVRFLGNNFFIVLASLLFIDALGLIIGGLIGAFLNVTLLLKWKGQEIYRALKSPRWIDVVYVAKKYKKFPKFTIWSDQVTALTATIPVLLMTSFVSLAFVGSYMLAQRLLKMPMTLIGNAIGESYFIEDNQSKHGVQPDKLIQLVNVLACTTAPFFFVVSAYGSKLFVWAFGEQWADAGFYSQLLSVQAYIMLVTSTCQFIALRIGLNKQILIFKLCTFCAILCSIGVGVIHNSPTLIVGLIALTLAAIESFFAIYVWRQVGLTGFKLFDTLANVLKLLTPFFIAVLIIRLFVLSDIQGLIFLVLLLLVVEYFYFYKNKNIYYRFINNFKRLN